MPVCSCFPFWWWFHECAHKFKTHISRLKHVQFIVQQEVQLHEMHRGHQLLALYTCVRNGVRKPFGSVVKTSKSMTLVRT